MEKNKSAEQIRDKIFRKQESLEFIKRVPEKTSKTFKTLANEDFVGDYGMTLKHLVDFYYGLIPKGWEPLEYKIAELRQEIQDIKKSIAMKEEEKLSGRKMLDGSTGG